MKCLILEKQALGAVARKFGVHRSTVWRWYKKWQEQNIHLELRNYNRPTVKAGRVFRQQNIRWNIPTITSAPHSHPHQIAQDIQQRIIALRHSNKRCAEVIHHQLMQEGITISLSSVKRILDRHHTINHWSKWKKRHTSIPRPSVRQPGDLVEVDTIHYINTVTRQKVYITTVIDLYTRMAHAKVSSRIQPNSAVKAIMEAKAKFGFQFAVVQSDNGLEFGKEFTSDLQDLGITHRHTRVRQPNDNAHIERFNRTLREECIGHHWSSKLTSDDLTHKLIRYLDYYNHDRIHLGLQCRTPIQMLQR